MDAARLVRTLNNLNRFGYADAGMTRLAYSPVERQAVAYFSGLCEREGMTVRYDPCGNLIARREGRHPELPVVAMGSHLDTVVRGGRYDGALGVAAALEVVRSLNDRRLTTDHPVEIIVFACEESSRFGVSTIGSKAMAGLLDKSSLAVLKDRAGLTLAEAFSQCGLDFDGIGRCARGKEEIKAFFELHIEQGPILENEGKPIGIVTGIAAPTRYEVTVWGRASHSGTTPMNGRRDAFLGAAEISLGLEAAAKTDVAYGTVATVGACEVKPGAMNVIPDTAELKLEIRGTSVESKSRVSERLFEVIRKIEKTRGLAITVKELSDELPTTLDGETTESLCRLCEREGVSYLRMTSGAGHDAMNMARLCPTGLVFVPSHAGISHCRDEYTSAEQIVSGASLLELAVRKWACSS
ncbi:M20 family metallo-hydrolase [Cohnella massiliensis]|uniref:M20 family metallo-hydrolase n=1 Tax=Cohnella massiliensis TaxID=1816691 RepID=UPI0009BC0B9B|nr:M20 family metallo-hydrolase [Cohnella massiliensis]